MLMGEWVASELNQQILFQYDPVEKDVLLNELH